MTPPATVSVRGGAGPVASDRVEEADVPDPRAAVAQVTVEPVEPDVVVDHGVAVGAGGQGHPNAGVPADQVGRQERRQPDEIAVGGTGDQDAATLIAQRLDAEELG